MVRTAKRIDSTDACDTSRYSIAIIEVPNLSLVSVDIGNRQPSTTLTIGFFTRDPIAYEGSEWDLYESLSSNALVAVDPDGLHDNPACERRFCHVQPQPPVKPLPGPGKGSNRKRPLGLGYLWCGCKPKADRLQPIPGVVNPPNNPLPGGSGPSTGQNQIYLFPTTPAGAVGTAGAGTCIALIVKCPGFVAVFHFAGGD